MMVYSKQLPSEVLTNIADQVARRLGVFRESSALFATELGATQPELDLGESFEVWILTPDAVDEFVTSGVGLDELARPAGTWHHQIRSDRRAKAFARSKPLGVSPESWSLREVFESPLAEEIDEAIRWIDQNISGETEARLLSAPAYQVEAFWLITKSAEGSDADTKNEVLIIRAPDYSTSKLEAMKLMTADEFLNALLHERSGSGLR